LIFLHWDWQFIAVKNALEDIHVTMLIIQFFDNGQNEEQKDICLCSYAGPKKFPWVVLMRGGIP
jgi:hypothetical protein